MDQRTVDYYARRERQARELAAKAIEHSTRAAHLKMADTYAGLLAKRVAEASTSPD